MFYLERKDKITIGFCLIALLCLLCYGIGYFHGTKDSVPQLTKTHQEDTAPPPPDTRLGISAATFMPNFNGYSSKHQILAYQHVYNDHIEFGNNIRGVIIVGKGNPDNLDYISVTFPKYDSEVLGNGKASICATIYAVSPTTTSDGRKLILLYLGLLDNVDSASGMKVFDYKGKRYSVNYDGDDVSFIAMTSPPL